MQLTRTQGCGEIDCMSNECTVRALTLDDDEVRRLIRIGESWSRGLHYPGTLTREVAVELVETLKAAD